MRPPSRVLTSTFVTTFAAIVSFVLASSSGSGCTVTPQHPPPEPIESTTPQPPRPCTGTLDPVQAEPTIGCATNQVCVDGECRDRDGPSSSSGADGGNIIIVVPEAGLFDAAITSCGPCPVGYVCDNGLCRRIEEF